MKKVIFAVVLATLFTLLAGMTVFAAPVANLNVSDGMNLAGEEVSLTFTITNPGLAGVSVPLGNLEFVSVSTNTPSIGANVAMHQAATNAILVNVASTDPFTSTFHVVVRIPAGTAPGATFTVANATVREGDPTFLAWWNGTLAGYPDAQANQDFYGWYVDATVADLAFLAETAAVHAFVAWVAAGGQDVLDYLEYLGYDLNGDNGNGNGA